MTSGNSPQIIAFNDTIVPLVQEFMAISTKLGEPVTEMALLVRQAFENLASLIEYGLHVNQPADEGAFFSQHPLSNSLKAIQDFRNKHRNNEYFNHLSSVSEAILGLSWVAVRPAPRQFIAEMIGAAEFYGNRVLSAFKNKPEHASFVQKWYEIMRQLEAYVKTHFTCGFTWGVAQGGQPNFQASAPPPPPPPPAQSLLGPEKGSGDGRPAYLADLNVGTQITNRLRHVEKNEKKNLPPPTSANRSIATSQKGSSTCSKNQPVHEPKLILDGRKWVVAYQIGNRTMKLDNEDMSQSLLMHNCQDSFLEIKNKINNVVIDSCKKTDLLVRDVISSVELINCERIKIQCDGSMPLINLAGCEQVEIFLNEQSRNLQVIASKSTTISLCVMKADGDYIELPMPEQIRSVISADNKLISSAVDNV